MNSLYIGLGGAGIASVATYAKMAQGKEVNRKDEFLYLDTDEYMVRQFPIMVNDFVLLGGGQMSLDTLIRRERYDLSCSDESRKKQARHFFSWFDENTPDRFLGELRMGSGANRMAARAMLFYEYAKVKHIITNKLPYVDENGNPRIREIFVVSGTCGGTGSGILLDILYVIQEIFQALMLSQHPFINLLLIMPEGYIRELGPQDVRYSKYCSNAYALFDEINACLKDYYYDFHGDDVNNEGMRWYKHRCYDDGTPPVRFHVFNNAILFDSVDSSTGEPLTSAQRSANVSNFLFIMESAKDTQDNLNTTISNQNRSCKFGSRNRPFIEGFSASGILVAQSWEELTRKYVKEKFIYQMLYYGFIGSGEELEPGVLEKDIHVFYERIDRLIADYQQQMHRFLTRRLEGIGKDELYRIVVMIKQQSSQRNAFIFKDVFYGDGDEMDMELRRLLMQVKNLLHYSCAEWAKRYNFNHALQIIEHLDRMCEMRWNNVVSRLNDAISKLQFPLRVSMLGRASRNEKVAALFADLVQYFVYRNLSDHGYLDDCRERLSEAISRIDLNHFEMTYGVSVGTWEHHYIKYLMALNYDSTKSVWPNLDLLLDREQACLREGNEVERDYASLVLQDGKDPDMRFDLSNDRLLYSYKNRCVEELNGEDEKWSTCFMAFMKGDRAGIIQAFKAYAQKVEQKAEELANAPELSKPFVNVFNYLSPDEQRILIDKLSSVDSISLSTQYHLQKPSMSLYLADFNNMPGLQGALAMGRLPAMNNHFVQSTDQIDRVEKLNVEFGYTPVDYRYYDRYKAEFDRCLQIPERIRNYQPFIDKRFLFNRKEGETLADMFLRETE